MSDDSPQMDRDPRGDAEEENALSPAPGKEDPRAERAEIQACWVGVYGEISPPLLGADTNETAVGALRDHAAEERDGAHMGGMGCRAEGLELERGDQAGAGHWVEGAEVRVPATLDGGGKETAMVSMGEDHIQIVVFAWLVALVYLLGAWLVVYAVPDAVDWWSRRRLEKQRARRAYARQRAFENRIRRYGIFGSIIRKRMKGER